VIAYQQARLKEEAAGKTINEEVGELFRITADAGEAIRLKLKRAADAFSIRSHPNGSEAQGSRIDCQNGGRDSRTTEPGQPEHRTRCDKLGEAMKIGEACYSFYYSRSENRSSPLAAQHVSFVFSFNFGRLAQLEEHSVYSRI
jgi:hypothetical protein